MTRMQSAAVNIMLLAFMAFGAAGAASAQTPESGGNAGLFTGKDAAAVINDAIARENAVSDIKVTVNEARDEDVIAQGAGTITAEAEGLLVDKAHSRWQAMLVVRVAGRNLAPIKLTGRYDEMATLPVLKRLMQNGQVISEDDIDWTKEPLAHLRKNTVTDMHDLIGKSPKHAITQGRAIRQDEIASPAIVAKGAKVTLVFKSHNIEIETYGETLEPGAKGDVIRVRNIASKLIIQGTVETGDRVRVTSPETDAAEAM